MQQRIIVCGAGLAGLTAGVSALENNARVTLVEKSPEVGGTALLSGGLLWTFADYEEMRSKVPLGDAALQWLVQDTLDGAMTWLEAQGARLGPIEHVLVHGRGRPIEPAQTIQALADRFVALGGELRFETAVEGLVMREGKVCGVRLTEGERVFEEEAAAVVLATGGFQGDPELVSRYILKDSKNLILRANPWSTGDGFRAATAAGAAPSFGLGTFYGHALAAPPARYEQINVRSMSQYYGLISVAINLNGERFADETEGTGEESLNQKLAVQPGARGFYIIDHSAIDITPIQGRPDVTRAILDRARAAGGVILVADTLEELAAELGAAGVPKERALATLVEFNTFVENGRGGELDPPRRGHQVPLRHAPFYAVAVQAAITFTMGGLQIDERGRVLRRAASSSPFLLPPEERAYVDSEPLMIRIGSAYRQSVIPGLFAAGCDTGNISHGGYVGGLATALTTGRAAGCEAARYVATRQAM